MSKTDDCFPTTHSYCTNQAGINTFPYINDIYISLRECHKRQKDFALFGTYYRHTRKGQSFL